VKTHRLLLRTAIVLILGAALVVLCCLFVDRPLAWFFNDHRYFPPGLRAWPPRISDWLKAAAAPAILFVIVWWAWKPGGRLQKVLLAISVNIIVTTVIKQLLKLACGRYWPETWKDKNNVSLIRDGVYGFHPFQAGPAYEAFPSGHAAVICCVLSILWFCYPRWRWLYALFGGSACAALVGMNYHFLGDVIAGVLLGSITGVWMTRLFRL
jgi:membrane-associated phospholipid phosphatase